MKAYNRRRRIPVFEKPFPRPFEKDLGWEARDQAEADEPFRDYQALPVCGINFSATPLLHQRCPVGAGPSSKRWP
jgi:hypothetical protein